MKRLRSLLIPAALMAALWLGFETWVSRTVLPELSTAHSYEVRDRNGALLRAYLTPGGKWRLRVGVEEVDKTYLAMLIRFEDKRFYDHSGVDLVAMLRSAWLSVRSGRVVSGGSTLTMQVARLIEGGGTGRWRGKLRQIRVALALERQLSKDQILEIYLNRAPFGGNIEGVRAASLAYFERPPNRLSTAQAALLVALPQSPERRRPDRNITAAQAARDHVVARMTDAGILDIATQDFALAQAVKTVRHPFPILAPHLSDRAVAQNLSQVTIDIQMQRAVQILAGDAVSGRSDALQVAIMVVDWRTGHVLASVGSSAYDAGTRAGFMDLTRAIRSPGSTLKPLIYGLGFDAGLLHPDTLIDDRPTDFAGYRPQNFDGQFRGPVQVRYALQQSLNIPAVKVTQAVGAEHLIAGMRRAGAVVTVPGEVPGLAVSLGGLGLTLSDLMRLYASFANGGVSVDLRYTQTPSPGFVSRPVLRPSSAWHIADILQGVPRPKAVQGAGVAYKTGTSYGHRDAWAIGFDGRHVIGVWMGRADGASVPGAFGGDLAAPVMFDAFARIKPKIDPIKMPQGGQLSSGPQLPHHLQRFGADASGMHSTLNIAFPPDGAVMQAGGVFAKVEDGQAPFTWLANGRPLAQTRDAQVDLGELGIGFSDVSVIDANGHSDRVRIELR